MKQTRIWKRILALVLTVAMLNSTMSPGTVQAAGNAERTSDSPQTVTLDTDDGSGDSESGDSDAGSGEEQNTPSQSADDTETGVADTGKTENAGAAAEQNVYADGSIRIYNAKQLEAVGSGNQVYSGDESADTFGTGDAVTDENGSAVVYGNDASYVLMNEIALDSANMWQLPDGFAGSFSGTGGSADSRLYDAETDTIYVYNNYQLATINDSDALKTVMSNDMIAEDFGMGQVVFADEAEETQLEYTAEHNYVLTTEFTSEMPELKAQALVANDGRKFQGQVIFTADDGTEYILIGNKEQLAAIGDEDRQVMSAAYQAYLRGFTWHIDTDENGQPVMLYGGDADLLQSQNGKKDYEFQQPDEHRGIHIGETRVDYCGVNQETGEIDVGIDHYETGHYYTSEENYIIFRDIDLAE